MRLFNECSCSYLSATNGAIAVCFLIGFVLKRKATAGLLDIEILVHIDEFVGGAAVLVLAEVTESRGRLSAHLLDVVSGTVSKMADSEIVLLPSGNLRLENEIGMELDEASVGGASDGNTIGEYTATLDGLGAVGDGAHASHEYVQASRLPERAALVALLLAAPLDDPEQSRALRTTNACGNIQ